MKNKTIIKEKKHLSRQEKKNIVLTILFLIISLGLGFIIAFFGKETSYIENELITAIITLFGFGLTATVFVYQTFEEKNLESNNIIKALSRTLLLIFCLIVASLILDFFVALINYEVFSVIIVSLKYATLIYSLICQFDILNSFIIIINSKKDN